MRVVVLGAAAGAPAGAEVQKELEGAAALLLFIVI